MSEGSGQIRKLSSLGHLVTWESGMGLQQSGDANVGSPVVASPRRTAALTPILATVLAASIILLVFMGGLRRGMDHVVENLTFGGVPTAVSIALSDRVYHLNAGYVAYATVLKKLEEVWDRGVQQPGDAIHFKNYADRELLNEGIRVAASLGPQAPGFISDRTLVTMFYADLGYVDFTKLAFRIFGLKIESLYYLYFLLLSLSAAAYLVVFGREPAPLAVLLCTLFSFFIELHTSIFTPDMPTFPGMRHGSTLALIPAWHFAMLVIYRRKPSAAVVATTLIQLAILVLVIEVRQSARWTLLFIPAVSLALASWAWRRRNSEERTWGRLLKEALQWPVVVLLGGFFAYNQYTQARLHPVYFTDDVTPYHVFWHAGYIGLIYASPDLLPEDSKILEISRVNLDQAGYAAATEYLNETHFMPLPSGFPNSIPLAEISPWTGGIKFKLYDDIMRRLVLRMVARHPFKVLWTLLYKKPILIIQTVYRLIAGAPDRTWLWLVMCGGLTAFGVFYWNGGPRAWREPSMPLFLVGAALPFTAVPNLWANAGGSIVSDSVLTTLILLQFLGCFTIGVVLHCGSMKLRVKAA
jgi:hypothetical protein